MNPPYDVWYVRFPDGQVVRAKNTDAVRRHVESRRIPVDSWVRRSPDEEWQPLEWTVEFGDLVRRRLETAEKAAEVSRASRLDAAAPAKNNGPAALRSRHDLQTVGVRGLMEELHSALDCTLSRPKLLLAALAGLLVAALVVLATLVPTPEEFPGWLIPGVAGLAGLVLTGLMTALLTQMTLVELSRLRPARWKEASARLGGNTVRLMVCFVLLGGGVSLAIAGLREWPAWVLDQNPGAEFLAAAATVLALVLEVLLWPILALALLFGPIVVMEECGLGQALVQWWRLLRQHLGRVLLYEALTAALGAVAVLPLLVGVLAAAWFSLADESFLTVKWSALSLLGGLALSPLAAYLVVANMFIYINLRYEFSPERK